MELQHKLLAHLLFVLHINQSCLQEALDNICLCVPCQNPSSSFVELLAMYCPGTASN